MEINNPRAICNEMQLHKYQNSEQKVSGMFFGWRIDLWAKLYD